MTRKKEFDPLMAIITPISQERPKELLLLGTESKNENSGIEYELTYFSLLLLLSSLTGLESVSVPLVDMVVGEGRESCVVGGV